MKYFKQDEIKKSSAIEIASHEGAVLEPEVSLQLVETDPKQVHIPKGNPQLHSSQIFVILRHHFSIQQT